MNDHKLLNESGFCNQEISDTIIISNISPDFNDPSMLWGGLFANSCTNYNFQCAILPEASTDNGITALVTFDNPDHAKEMKTRLSDIYSNLSSVPLDVKFVL